MSPLFARITTTIRRLDDRIKQQVLAHPSASFSRLMGVGMAVVMALFLLALDPVDTLAQVGLVAILSVIAAFVLQQAKAAHQHWRTLALFGWGLVGAFVLWTLVARLLDDSTLFGVVVVVTLVVAVRVAQHAHAALRS